MMNFFNIAPSDSESLYLQAGLSHQSGQHLDAMLLLEDAIRQQPSAPYKFFEKLGCVCAAHAMSLRGESDQRERDIYFIRAGKAYAQALRHHPDDSGAAFCAAAYYYNGGDFENAGIYAEKALAFDPGDENGIAILALCCLRLEKYAGAEDIYQSAIEHAEDSPYLERYGAAMLRLGLAKAIEAKAQGQTTGRRGDFRKMEDLLKEAYILGEAHVLFVLELAEFYLRNKDHIDLIASGESMTALSKAQRFAHAVIEQHPKDSESEHLEQAKDILKRCSLAYENFMEGFAERLGFNSAASMYADIRRSAAGLHPPGAGDNVLLEL